MAKSRILKTPAKKRPSKKKVAATRRSTAGTGFDFEDYVAGWLLLQALAGREIPVQGQAQRLQMQTSSLGWDIDDILLTTQGKVGDQRLIVSCKSNVQVSANGLPLSFAAQAWRLWIKADTPLNRAADCLGAKAAKRWNGPQIRNGEWTMTRRHSKHGNSAGVSPQQRTPLLRHMRAVL